MKISLIVAMAANRAIGLNNQMPWHLSADLKRFKQLTMGKPIIMGRKTFESIGRPLPGRLNIVVSRNSDYQPENCRIAGNLSEALAIAAEHNPEAFVIGGASLYQEALPIADTIYLTRINRDFPGDVFFPEIDLQQWQEVSKEPVDHDQSVDFSYIFLKLERHSVKA